MNLILRHDGKTRIIMARGHVDKGKFCQRCKEAELAAEIDEKNIEYKWEIMRCHDGQIRYEYCSKNAVCAQPVTVWRGNEKV